MILPCLGRSELDIQAGGPQFVSCENSMGIVSRSEGRSQPASTELKSEVAIVGLLAAHTLTESGVPWRELTRDYDAIRDLIEEVVPGFENYNERIRSVDGFMLPNSARDRRWKTASGYAEFTVHPIPQIQLSADQFLMATIRSHDQYNTTIYGLDDRYRGVYGERRVVMIHPDDIAELGMQEGQVVNLKSHFSDEVRTAERFVLVALEVPRRCVFTYFPEANPLVPLQSVADRSNTPTSKSIVITIHPSA